MDRLLRHISIAQSNSLMQCGRNLYFIGVLVFFIVFHELWPEKIPVIDIELDANAKKDFVLLVLMVNLYFIIRLVLEYLNIAFHTEVVNTDSKYQADSSNINIHSERNAEEEITHRNETDDINRIDQRGYFLGVVNWIFFVLLPLTLSLVVSVNLLLSYSKM